MRGLVIFSLIFRIHVKIPALIILGVLIIVLKLFWGLIWHNKPMLTNHSDRAIIQHNRFLFFNTCDSYWQHLLHLWLADVQFYMFEFSSRFTSFFEPKPYKQEIGGQSYNGSKIVNYDSRGSPDKKIAHIMTLGS